MQWFCFAAKINAHISPFMGLHSHTSKRFKILVKFQRITPKWHILFNNSTFQPTLTFIKCNTSVMQKSLKFAPMKVFLSSKIVCFSGYEKWKLCMSIMSGYEIILTLSVE